MNQVISLTAPLQRFINEAFEMLAYRCVTDDSLTSRPEQRSSTWTSTKSKREAG